MYICLCVTSELDHVLDIMHRTVSQLELPYLGGPCPGIIYHSPEFMGLIMNAIFCLLAFRNENKLFTVLDAPLLSLFGSIFFSTSWFDILEEQIMLCSRPISFCYLAAARPGSFSG